MAQYVPGEVPTTQDIAQLERWLRMEFEQIRNSTDDIYELATVSAASFVAAGYGGVANPGPALFDVGAAYTTVPFTADLLPEPRGITQSPAEDGLRLDYPGVWLLMFSCTLAGHNSLNSGRTITLRLWNADKSEATAAIPIGVGRNVEDTNITVQTLFDMGDGSLGDLFQVLLGGDAVTGGSLVGVEFSIVRAGQYDGIIDIGALATLRRRG